MSYGKEIYDNFINYCKEINMVNWIYELEWNCDGNLLFYIQNEGEGIALLWQCECQHSAAIYVLNHSFLYKWGNKAKEKRNELNEFVKNLGQSFFLWVSPKCFRLSPSLTGQKINAVG